MTIANEALTQKMLEWISSKPRTRDQILEVWRTNCPKLSIWEDACIAGLVEFSLGGVVTLSPSGERFLAGAK